MLGRQQSWTRVTLDISPVFDAPFYPCWPGLSLQGCRSRSGHACPPDPHPGSGCTGLHAHHHLPDQACLRHEAGVTRCPQGVSPSPCPSPGACICEILNGILGLSSDACQGCRCMGQVYRTPDVSGGRTGRPCGPGWRHGATRPGRYERSSEPLYIHPHTSTSMYDSHTPLCLCTVLCQHKRRW